jgi:hypothetical protein
MMEVGIMEENIVLEEDTSQCREATTTADRTGGLKGSKRKSKDVK